MLLDDVLTPQPGLRLGICGRDPGECGAEEYCCAGALALWEECRRLREENARLREDLAATSAAWAQAYDAAGQMWGWMHERSCDWATSLLRRHDWLPEAARACRTALDAPETPTMPVTLPDGSQCYLTPLERVAVAVGTALGVLKAPETREVFQGEGAVLLGSAATELMEILGSLLQKAAVTRIASYTVKHCQPEFWEEDEP